MAAPARILLALCAALTLCLIPGSSPATEISNVRFQAHLHNVQFRSGLTIQVSEADLSDPPPPSPGTPPGGGATTPEPGTFALLGMGLVAVGWAGRRRRR